MDSGNYLSYYDFLVILDSSSDDRNRNTFYWSAWFKFVFIMPYA